MRLSTAVIGAAAVATAATLAYLRLDRDGPEHSSQTTRPPPTGDGSEPDDPPPTREPPAVPGETVEVELAAAPAARYGDDDGDDDDYAVIARRVAGDRAVYDLGLARAAREVAFQGAVLQQSPPEALTTFVLHSSGAPDASVARFSLHTNDDSDRVIERAIEEATANSPSGDGLLYIGVGEAETPGEVHSRRVVVLMARRAYILEPAERLVAPGGRWRLRGELPVGYLEPSARVLYPDGRLETVDLDLDEARFSMVVDAGDVPGTMHVGVDGTGAGGPGKLFQLSVEVGSELPRRFAVHIPEPDPSFVDLTAAEDHARRLLAGDRARADLPALDLDPLLAAIARAHSEDMRDGGFFGHRSPATGVLGDRLRAAGYRATAFAENLAKNDNLAEAEATLLGSVGHRANLLSDAFTHVGVGLAEAEERGRRQWFVTQVFARKVVRIDPGAAALELAGRIDAGRRAADRATLEPFADLDQLAREGAEQAAAGDLEGLPQRLGERASRIADAAVTVSVHALFDLDKLELPAAAVNPEFRRLGVGVHQSADDPAGRTGVVIILSR